MFWRSHLLPPGDSGRGAHPPLAIALQGGGAYGAFAWGVLDRLLEEEDFWPAALSGASAGAVNAVVLASGLLNGGREGGRAALRRLWTTVGDMSRLSPFGLPGVDLQFDLMTRVLSPYQFNPLNINPLREFLAELIDFGQLGKDRRLSLFISATDVGTGDQRIFREGEITIDVLMASSCIPYLHHAVEIDGRAYWDGGFSANPPILPLVRDSPCRSLLVIKLTPQAEPALPTAAPDIFSRLNRILFNVSLRRDLDALDEMRKLLGRSTLMASDLRRLRDLSVRSIAIDDEFFGLAHFGPTGGSARDPRPDLLNRLHESGRRAAEQQFFKPLVP